MVISARRTHPRPHDSEMERPATHLPSLGDHAALLDVSRRVPQTSRSLLNYHHIPLLQLLDFRTNGLARRLRSRAAAVTSQDSVGFRGSGVPRFRGLDRRVAGVRCRVVGSP